MASFCFTKPALAISKLIFFLNIIAILISCVFSYKFEVGGDNGWTTPSSANFTTDLDDPYNIWASKNRFRIGDTLDFRYQNDSVLVVNYKDYENCTLSNPISAFDDGNTGFEFNRSGFFYFISGQPDHCKQGQKLIIRVIHPSEDHHNHIHPPESAPSPGIIGHGPSGSITSSTTQLSALGTCVITALATLLAILYLFV